MAQKKVKNNKLSIEELQTLSKEELISRFIKIQEHNIQLKNILSKLQLETKRDPVEKNNKQFDFSKWETQHVFIKFLYLGWDYHGYAVVEDTLNTIEHHMMEALKKCRLIESRDTADYHRCGRTDKGVSAFSQVISLKVRKGKDGGELDYCGMLNRLLPQEIRVTAWCLVEPVISARFNCTKRLYSYFFPRACLNLSVMQEAASYLVGTHDFRNFCKMDVANGVTNFTRAIFTAEVKQLPNTEDSGYSMCELTVLGSGFLWHQIRCIMAVLLMVGRGDEKPSIITELLNIQQCPKKPQYTLAAEVGLCLYHTHFDVETLWNIDNHELYSVISHLQSIWSLCAIKTEMVRSMLRSLESQYGSDSPQHQSEILLGTRRPRQHQPLLLRNTCHSFEERVENNRKKFKSFKEHFSNSSSDTLVRTKDPSQISDSIT